MKKILLLLVTLFVLNGVSNAQYNTEKMFLCNQYDIINLNHTCFIGSELIYDDGIISLNWAINNDTVPGVYIVYKSYNFTNMKPIEFFKINSTTCKNKTVVFHMVDKNYNPEYNFYHILKYDDLSSVIVNDLNFKEQSMNNIFFEPSENKYEDQSIVSAKNSLEK